MRNSKRSTWAVKARKPLQDRTNILLDSDTLHQKAGNSSKRTIRTRGNHDVNIVGDGETSESVAEFHIEEEVDSSGTTGTAQSEIRSARKTFPKNTAQVARHDQIRRPHQLLHVNSGGGELPLSIDDDHATDASQHLTLDNSESLDEDNMFTFTGSVLQATPLAAQLSSHALKSFKRRPRQPSMLAMVKQRMASARSSLAGTEVDPATTEDIYDVDDIEDDFQPHLSGTPVRVANASKPPRDVSHETNTKGVQHKSRSRRSGHSPGPLSQIQSSANEPNAIELVRMRRSSRRNASSVQTNKAEHATTTFANDNSQSGDEFVTAAEDGLIGLDMLDADQADTPAITHQVAASPEDSSVFADPSTQQTPSPDRGRGKRRKLNKVPSTADLQSLLPRRRRAFGRAESVVRDEYDQSSDLGTAADDDDSFHPAGNAGSIRPKAARKPSRAQASRNTSRSRSRHALRERQQDITTVDTRSVTRKGVARSGRTYKRKVDQQEGEASDLMEQPQHDQENLADTTTTFVTSISDAMEAAKEKFAEIDQWSLEFENVTPEDLNSSQEYR